MRGAGLCSAHRRALRNPGFLEFAKAMTLRAQDLYVLRSPEYLSTSPLCRRFHSFGSGGPPPPPPLPLLRMCACASPMSCSIASRRPEWVFHVCVDTCCNDSIAARLCVARARRLTDSCVTSVRASWRVAMLPCICWMVACALAIVVLLS